MSRLDVDKRLSTQAYVCRFTDGRRHDSRVAAANVYFVAAFLLQFSAARPEGSFATTKATLQRQNCQSVLHLRLQNSRIDQALIPQVAFATTGRYKFCSCKRRGGFAAAIFFSCKFGSLFFLQLIC